MKRRAFIKGLLATGMLALAPVRAIAGAFKPEYITATDVLRKRDEFSQKWGKSLTKDILRMADDDTSRKIMELLNQPNPLLQGLPWEKDPVDVI